MSHIDVLRERLDGAYRGSPYHSLLGSLKGVTDEQAAWIPPWYRGFPHMTGSILNLAYHVAGDKHVLLSYAFGDRSVTWESVETRFGQLGGNLAAARSLAEEGHSLALATLAELDGPLLESARPYYGSRTHTAAEVFGIIAEHDLYHAGQISYIRCLLAGIGRQEGAGTPR